MSKTQPTKPSHEAAELARYVHQILGTTIRPREVELPAGMPYLLAEQYRFLTFELVSNTVFGLLPRGNTPLEPAQVRKHLDLATKPAGALCVLVAKALPSITRARLIAQHVPFIVPGNQLYLPDLGLDLREHFRALRQKPERLGPASQLVLLYALLRLRDATATPDTLARPVGYTAMTLTRVADELEDGGLVTTRREGRKRIIDFGEDKRALWKRALPLLHTPVARTMWVRAHRGYAIPQIPLAGVSALAETTLLAAPEKPCLAAARDDWPHLLRHGIEVVPHEEMADAQVQEWRYDPAVLADGGTVDPLSLYLSLKDDDDDRVAAALEERMRSVPWL